MVLHRNSIFILEEIPKLLRVCWFICHPHVHANLTSKYKIEFRHRSMMMSGIRTAVCEDNTASRFQRAMGKGAGIKPSGILTISK